MKFKNLMNIGTDFQKFQNAYFEIFADCPSEVFLLMYFFKKLNEYNHFSKLRDDKSFYLSIQKINEECFGNKCSRNSIKKYLKGLEEKNFIQKFDGEKGFANYFKLNFDHINSLVGQVETVIEEDYVENEIQEQPEIPAVAKNETTENKKKSSAKKTKKEESNALTIVETKVPIEDAMSYKQRIITAWNTIASRYETTPSIAIVTDTRLKKFKNILKFANMDEHQFFNAINKALSESKFLRGIGKKWRANFDFFLNQNSFLKVIEGAYKDNPNEIMEILQDPSKMSFKEAEDLREKIKIKELEEKYKQEEAEEQLVLP